MVVNEAVSALTAVLLAYLLGAFPSAYVITRLLTGKDIRQLGSGNVGANNTYHEVGRAAGIATGIIDCGKGAGAAALAHLLLGAPFFQASAPVLLAGIAAVAGHIWPIYLKFNGGNGLAPGIAILAVVLPKELLIACGLIVILWAATRNVILATNISLFSVPVSAWFLEREWLYIAFFFVLEVIIILHFLPTARAALHQAGSMRNLLADLLKRGRQ